MHVDDWLSQPPNLTRSCWHCRTKHHWHGGQYQRLSIHCIVLKEAQHPWGWLDSIQQRVCSVGRGRSRAHLLRPACDLSVSSPTLPSISITAAVAEVQCASIFLIKMVTNCDVEGCISAYFIKPKPWNRTPLMPCQHRALRALPAAHYHRPLLRLHRRHRHPGAMRMLCSAVWQEKVAEGYQS